MIDFSTPEKVLQQAGMAEMVAKTVMRPTSRKYDENEHERPVEFINFMWPVMADQQKANLERARRKAESASNGEGENGSKKESTANIALLFTIERLAWGDVAQYLSLPSPGLGGFAIEAVGTLEQKERFLTRFADSKGKP